jgi:Ca2+-binding EF-hand superfamily protein
LLDLRMLFDKQDADNSGCIDKGEVGKMISDLGFKLSDSELDQYFNHMDTDGSGVVGFKEFCTAVLECAAMERSRFQGRAGHTSHIDAGHCEGQADDLEFFSKTFSFFDLDNSGYIDATEMHARLEGNYLTMSPLLGIPPHARPNQIKPLFG